jgi:uncharacterized protein (TIGR03435 family)
MDALSLERLDCAMNQRLLYLERSLGKSAFYLAALLSAAIPAAGQNGAPAPATAQPTALAVASVRSSKPDCPGMSVSSPPGQFSAQCITFLGLLFNAYPIRRHDTIPGLPGWGTSALFDVEAKADDATAEAIAKLPQEEQWKQDQSMLQGLLASRFKLRVHTETRKGDVYTLVLAKGGFKLKDAPESTEPSGYSWVNGHIQVRKGPIASLVLSLSDTLGHTVVDKTGLTGNYDINLRWTPDDQQESSNGGVALFNALEEQLGLKLLISKGPVNIFVIDHVEKPAEN